MKGRGFCASGPSPWASLPTPTKRGLLVPNLPCSLVTQSPSRYSPVKEEREASPNPHQPPADTHLHTLLEARQCVPFHPLLLETIMMISYYYLYRAVSLCQAWCYVPYFTDRERRLRDGK